MLGDPRAERGRPAFGNWLPLVWLVGRLRAIAQHRDNGRETPDNWQGCGRQRFAQGAFCPAHRNGTSGCLRVESRKLRLAFVFDRPVEPTIDPLTPSCRLFAE